MTEVNHSRTDCWLGSLGIVSKFRFKDEVNLSKSWLISISDRIENNRYAYICLLKLKLGEDLLLLQPKETTMIFRIQYFYRYQLI